MNSNGRTITGSSEQGNTLIFFLVILSAIIAIATLVIDNGRQQVTARQLQDAVDATALAAARSLDGSLEGWLNAKRAALMTLQSQAITGMPPLPEDFRFKKDTLPIAERDKAVDDVFELNDPSFQSTMAQTADGRWHVTVERGVYWHEDLSNNPQFHSLEGAKEKFNLYPYHLANAVRVTVKLTGIPLTFASGLGWGNGTNFERSSVSVLDSSLAECVVPIAIPACHLMADINPSEPAKYDPVNRSRGEEMCQREIVASSAITEDERIADGRVRSSVYPRPLITNGKINPKGIPIDGIFGVPITPETSSEDTVTPANRKDVIDVLARTGGCVTAKLGQRFRPMDEPDEILNSDELDTQLSNLIAGRTAGAPTPKTVREVFMSGSTPQPNFPHLRVKRTEYKDPSTELRYTWPAKPPDESILLLNSRKDLEYTNPLCHSPNVSYPNDLDRGKVIPVTVMIVAPSSEEGMKYCDYAAMFNEKEQDAFPVASRTEPRIVGFKRAYLFDYNIKDLQPREYDCKDEEDCKCSKEYDKTPPAEHCDVNFYHPENGVSTVADDPASAEDLRMLSDVVQLTNSEIKRFVADLKSYKECLRCVPCAKKNPRKGCKTTCPACKPPEPPATETKENQPLDNWKYCFSLGRTLFPVSPGAFCGEPVTYPPFSEPEPSGSCAEYNTQVVEVDCPPGWTGDTPCTTLVYTDCKTYSPPDYLAQLADWQSRLDAFQLNYRTNVYPASQMKKLDAEIRELLGDDRADNLVPIESNPVAHYWDQFCSSSGGYSDYFGRSKEPFQNLFAELKLANDRLKNRGSAKRGRHCLPKKIDDCFASPSYKCWESPRDKKPQFGCSGARLRLSCEKQQVLTTPRPLSEMKPILVE